MMIMCGCHKRIENPFRDPEGIRWHKTHFLIRECEAVACTTQHVLMSCLFCSRVAHAQIQISSESVAGNRS